MLAYYAIANAAAWTLEPDPRGRSRWSALLGGLGCVVLAFTLPLAAVIAGSGVLALGAAIHLARRRSGPGRALS